MAGERTESATPRRLQKMRSEGRVAKSADLAAAAGLLVSIFAVKQFGGDAVDRLRSFMIGRLAELPRTDITDVGLGDLLLTASWVFVAALLPFMILLPLVGVLATLGQTGLVFSSKGLKPDPNNINPINGAKRMFSIRSLVEVAKATVKTVIVGVILYQAYAESVPTLLALAQTDPRAASVLFAETAIGICLAIAAAFFALAILDFGYQRWQFARDARMSLQDVKEEYKESEGSPEVKSAIRKRQRKLAQQRMMQAVPQADVVITNPTHLAVALSYRTGEMAAPVVVAKGGDLIAQRIKQIAREHDVPVVENKPVARALYAAVEVDQQIPAELFQAVAEVLAYIYALKRRRGRPTYSTIEPAPQASSDFGSNGEPNEGPNEGLRVYPNPMSGTLPNTDTPDGGGPWPS